MSCWKTVKYLALCVLAFIFVIRLRGNRTKPAFAVIEENPNWQAGEIVIVTIAPEARCTPRFNPFPAICAPCKQMTEKPKCNLRVLQALGTETQIVIVADDDVLFSESTFQNTRRLLVDQNATALFGLERSAYPPVEGRPVWTQPDGRLSGINAGVFLGYRTDLIQLLGEVIKRQAELEDLWVDPKAPSWFSTTLFPTQRVLHRRDDQLLTNMRVNEKAFERHYAVDYSRAMVFNFPDAMWLPCSSEAHFRGVVSTFNSYCRGYFDAAKRSVVMEKRKDANERLCSFYPNRLRDVLPWNWAADRPQMCDDLIHVNECKFLRVATFPWESSSTVYPSLMIHTPGTKNKRTLEALRTRQHATCPHSEFGHPFHQMKLS